VTSLRVRHQIVAGEGRRRPEKAPESEPGRFATVAYAAERDLMAVQQLLGHAKPETTAVCAQVPDGALMRAVRATSL
jgi:site-specific recombinase XerC